MYIIREVFKAKPGQAGKLAKLFKKMPMGKNKFRVMTDMVGPYNTVVTEIEVESLAEWEAEMLMYRSGKTPPGQEMSPELAEEMSHYTDMYIEGRREIYQITE